LNNVTRDTVLQLLLPLLQLGPGCYDAQGYYLFGVLWPRLRCRETGRIGPSRSPVCLDGDPTGFAMARELHQQQTEGTDSELNPPASTACRVCALLIKRRAKCVRGWRGIRVRMGWRVRDARVSPGPTNHRWRVMLRCYNRIFRPARGPWRSDRGRLPIYSRRNRQLEMHGAAVMNFRMETGAGAGCSNGLFTFGRLDDLRTVLSS
jgi:hypothetical protein